MKELRNARVSLALHPLQSAEGVPLLLLHALGGSAQDFRPALPAAAGDHTAFARWPGPAHALDFSGHGHSGRVHGGGYYPELWASDADLALAALGGRAVVLGVGLGAYVALLLAGGRREQVCCAVLCPGAGLEGGGAEPDWSQPVPDVATAPLARELQASASTDHAVLTAQSSYVRPPEYAARFGASAQRLVLLEDGADRPPWWRALRDAPSSVPCAAGRGAWLAHALPATR